MDTTILIIIIVALLIVAVGTSGYFQFREQQKAERRQNFSKFNYRAREGQELYDRFHELPIGADTRKVILQYIAVNLTKALQVEPGANELKNTLNEIQQRIESPALPADKQRLRPPSDPQELVVLMGRVKSLVRYIHKIGRMPGIDIGAASNGLNNLKRVYLNLQTQTYIAIGKKKVSEKAFPQAFIAFDNAKKLLLRQNIADDETQATLQELERLMQETKQQRQPVDPSVDAEHNEEESLDLGDSDDLFQPKKKW
ncbi:hypothetical protein [Pleionea litopenaei]|uniref:Uncharacterized protein n=1 Tax=Pleionea litopenaei TaxID=3070815 RepID=A0AA51RV19_9GAMM|nr:hypothetical protein [Pleionea sp. HL-JVS1]WMS88141.1 hypothetical protein Q9312_04310 [Pleionea sp. HL-JVS1]